MSFISNIMKSMRVDQDDDYDLDDDYNYDDDYDEEPQRGGNIFTKSKSQEAMAARVGKKQSTIANKLRLLRLGSAVRKVLVDAGLSERHARALLKLEDDAKRLEALEVVVAKNYSVRQTEEYIAKLLDNKQQEKRKRLMIVNDVRIYLNSIKQVVSAIKDVGIPVNMEQSFDGDEVVISVRIKNQKKNKDAHSKPLF